jgi:hypothetical protein
MLVFPVVARCQTLSWRIDAVGTTYQEIADHHDALGAGVGGGLGLRVKRFRLDVRAHTVAMNPDSAVFATYRFTQLDIRGGYQITPLLTLEVGGGRRYVTPAFSAQEVGYTRVGILSENAMNRLATVWVRGAVLPEPHFSGGGSAELAFEFSLGIGVGTANHRFRFHAEYEFQRMDRSIGEVSVPLQLSLAKTGFTFGF